MPGSSSRCIKSASDEGPQSVSPKAASWPRVGGVCTRHVGLHAAGVAGERLGVEAARRERRGRHDLQLAATGEGVFDGLLVDGGVEREHAHGPAPAHVVVEGGAGLGIGIRADERACAGCAAGRVAHVGGQPLIEER
jgi:hypothetical protein